MPGLLQHGGAARTQVRADEGLFGADSVARRVWKYPTSAILGFIRAVTIEHLDPNLTASVDASGQVLQRPALRYDRTVQYFATILYGDAEAAITASDILMRVHERSFGDNPTTGGTYDANDPESQLWIHMTAWHSILYVYEKFGPGRLSRAEEQRYWRECAIAAAMQPIHLEDVPRSRGEVQAYFDRWRDKISTSETALGNIEFILDGPRTIFVELPAPLRWVMAPFMRKAVIATYPRWMRPLMGVRQSRFTDAVVTTGTRAVMAALASSARTQEWFLRRVSPRGVGVIVPHIYNQQAATSTVYTPKAARAKFGDPRTPLQQYAEQLAKRDGAESAVPYQRNHHDPVLDFAEHEAVVRQQ